MGKERREKMIDEFKQLLVLVEKIPTITLWVLAGFALFKLIVYLSTTGSVVFVSKLLIEKIHDAVTRPRQVSLGRLPIDEETFESLKSLLSGLAHHRHVKSVKEYGITAYLHGSDVEWLRQAINEKQGREFTKEKNP